MYNFCNISKFILLLSGFLFVSCSQSNQNENPKKSDSVNGQTKAVVQNTLINDENGSLAKFVPTGYSILDTTAGDLNLDKYPDMILVLKKNGEDTTSNVVEHPEKRPLLILIGQPDNTYQLADKSDNAVYCVDCGGVMGDPFMAVVIKDGYFSIEHYGGSSWRWTRVVTFKYAAADSHWYLHKDGHESFHVSEPEKVEKKIYTTKDFGKVPFNQFDIYKEK